MKTQVISFLLMVFAIAVGCTTQPVSDRSAAYGKSALVLMTDFSLKDGAVSAMRGVAFQVDPEMTVSDLTHEVPPYNIWEGGYRLSQTFTYWPSGTVFVSVVDPGVGSDRKSIVAKSKTGHYFVNPDNGLLTLIQDQVGIESVREIDEAKRRRKGSEESYTFHGRDVYVFVGAQLASRQLTFEQVGTELKTPLIQIPYQKPQFQGQELKGLIPILDPNYGNVWTNLPKSMMLAQFRDKKIFQVRIFNKGKKVFDAKLPLVDTFSQVPQGKPLLYFNSLMNLSLALNMENFAKRHQISSGPDWTISIKDER